MDVGEAEILLARKLSCGEPHIRKRALLRLEQRINAQSAKNKCSAKEDLLRLWKGLHYCFWLQDKPLLQEELVDNIAKLVDSVEPVDQKLLFLEAFYEQVGSEWKTVDQWRVDKYLMFFRRMFRRVLAWLKSVHFQDAHVGAVFGIWGRFLLNADSDSYPTGLKLHFASVYLDEIDNAGALAQMNTFLRPFFDILAQKKTSHIFFNAIMKDVFLLILEFCVHRKDEVEDGTSSEPALEFDFTEIRNSLFHVGKTKTVTAKRRSRIYDLVKKYDEFLGGQNPFEMELSDESSSLSDAEIETSARKFVRGLQSDKSQHEQFRRELKEVKKRKMSENDHRKPTKQELKKIGKVKNKFKRKKVV